MIFQLTARTRPGQRLVALAERLAEEIRPNVAEHDRDGSFPFESLARVKQSGYLTAPVPEQLGGLGVTSVHDLVVASSRLARGDAALSIGVNMHFAYLVNVLRRWQIATARGNERRADAFGRTLAEIAGEDLVFAAAISEPAHTSRDRPRSPSGPTTAGSSPAARSSAPCRRRQTCSTRRSPTSTIAAASSRLRRRPHDRGRRLVHDDWDALGIRPRKPLRLVQGRPPAAPRPPRRLPRRRRGRVHRAQPRRRPLPRSRLARDRRARHAHVTGRIAGNGRQPDGRARGLAAENAVERPPARRPRPGRHPLLDAHLVLDLKNRPCLPLRRGVGRQRTLDREEAAVRIVDRALALSGRRRLPERQSARPRLPRRPRDRVHAPPRRQPRLRLPRRARLRRRAHPPLTAMRHFTHTLIVGAGQAGLCAQPPSDPRAPAMRTPSSSPGGSESAGTRSAGTRRPCSPPAGSAGWTEASLTPSPTASSAARTSSPTSTATHARSAPPCTST